MWEGEKEWLKVGSGVIKESRVFHFKMFQKWYLEINDSNHPYPIDVDSYRW